MTLDLFSGTSPPQTSGALGQPPSLCRAPLPQGPVTISEAPELNHTPLRDYQRRAVAACLASDAHVCLVAPTGSGKTRMGIAILESTPGPAVWVVHRRELLAQADRALGALRSRVTPVMVQGSVRPDANTVVLDEAHHYAADEWSRLLELYPHARHIGLTATPERQDGRGLDGLFSELVTAADYSELIEAGHLVDCRVIRPDQRLDRGLAQDPVAAYLAHANGRAGFAYVPRIDSAQELAAAFCDAGIPAACIEQGTPAADRDAAISDLATGRLKILTNVYALTEGVDIPSASVCILARGVGHVGPYLQMVGRILRPAPDKTEAILIDLPGVSYEHGFPTENRAYSLSGLGIRSKSLSVTTCPMCGESYETGPLACPECGFVKPTQDFEPLRIYDIALKAVYKGRATPEDAKQREWARLYNRIRERNWSLDWALKQYRRLFGGLPDLSAVSSDERRAIYEQFATTARERGFKPGFAAVRYKQLFGAWPPWAWSRGGGHPNNAA